MPSEGSKEPQSEYQSKNNETIIIEHGDTKLAYCTVIIVSILAILVLVKK